MSWSTDREVKKFDRTMKSVKKRITKVTSEECYDLTKTFVLFAVPRLERLREDAIGTMDYNWTELDTVIKAFRRYLVIEDFDYEDAQKIRAEFHRACQLFGKLLPSLRW